MEDAEAPGSWDDDVHRAGGVWQAQFDASDAAVGDARLRAQRVAAHSSALAAEAASAAAVEREEARRNLKALGAADNPAAVAAATVAVSMAAAREDVRRNAEGCDAEHSYGEVEAGESLDESLGRRIRFGGFQLDANGQAETAAQAACAAAMSPAASSVAAAALSRELKQERDLEASLLAAKADAKVRVTAAERTMRDRCGRKHGMTWHGMASCSVA